MKQEKRPDKICRVGGREFQIFREYDDICEKDILIYPNFSENPEYTDEGCPFTKAVCEGCPHFAHKSLKKKHNYEDCGSCKWFRRDETPLDLIGVCMCSALKKK